MLNGVNLMNNLGLSIFCGVDVVKRGSELCFQLTWRRGKSSMPLNPRALTGSGSAVPSNSRRMYIPET